MFPRLLLFRINIWCILQFSYYTCQSSWFLYYTCIICCYSWTSTIGVGYTISEHKIIYSFHTLTYKCIEHNVTCSRCTGHKRKWYKILPFLLCAPCSRKVHRYSRVNKWNSLIFIKTYLSLKQLPNVEPWYYFLYFCLSTTLTIILFQCNFINKWRIGGLAALQWVCHYQGGKKSGTNSTFE